jgi:hypothetical protein
MKTVPQGKSPQEVVLGFFQQHPHLEFFLPLFRVCDECIAVVVMVLIAMKNDGKWGVNEDEIRQLMDQVKDEKDKYWEEMESSRESFSHRVGVYNFLQTLTLGLYGWATKKTVPVWEEPQVSLEVAVARFDLGSVNAGLQSLCHRNLLEVSIKGGGVSYTPNSEFFSHILNCFRNEGWLK